MTLAKAVHADLLQKVVNFEVTGAVALSELGHGSNTGLIETVAHYDQTSDCYILNTPNDMAQKYWCGGAASMFDLKFFLPLFFPYNSLQSLLKSSLWLPNWLWPM